MSHVLVPAPPQRLPPRRSGRRPPLRLNRPLARFLAWAGITLGAGLYGIGAVTWITGTVF
jgi:hypothetical protein